MPPKPQTQVSELAIDTASLAVPLPGTQTPAPQPEQLAELERMLKVFLQHGTIQRRPDGSFVMPGYVDPRQAQVDERGSDCACGRCTPHNQLHWYCAGCYNGPHEWVIRQPKGDPIIILGQAGKSGKSYQFCTTDCGRAFRQRHNMAQPGTAVMHMPDGLGDIPIAGGDV